MRSKEQEDIKINKWLTLVPVIVGVFIFAINETLANVALPYIAGTISISNSESTWILTSYLVAAGISIPMMPIFCKLIGRKGYFIMCLALFAIGSTGCAFSNSMLMIIIFRFIQGFGGGGLLPLGQAITLENFKGPDMEKAISLYGVAFIFGPVIGPVIGGWITENWAWQWIFILNIPFTLIDIILVKKMIFDPPYARKQKNVKIDVWGIVFLSIWLVTLQTVLDKGNDADWFADSRICILSLISVISAIIFFYIQSVNKNPLIDLSVFKDRIYFWGTFIQMILLGVFLASAALLPAMLQSLMGYTSYLSGLSLGSRGLGNIFGILIYNIICKKIGNRRITMLGLIGLGIGCFWLGMMNLQITLWSLLIPNMLFGFGIAFALTAMIPLSCKTIPPEKMGDASGIQNMLKNIGGAIGTSVAMTMVARSAQTHQFMLISNLGVHNPVFIQKTQAIAQHLNNYYDITTAQYLAKVQIYRELLVQSHLWGFIDTFRTLAIVTFLLIVLLPLVRGDKKTS